MTFQERIQKIVDKHGLPYLDVVAFNGYQSIFRYVTPNATGEERLQMFSMSKIFTVVSVMQLIEKGKLSLKDKVNKFFPCFNETYYLKDGKVLKNKKIITIKNLLQMTSGLTYNVDDPNIKEVYNQKGDTATLKDFIPSFIKTPLCFKVGTSFEYGLSHDVLAGVVEVVTGLTFDEYVEKNIFKPLGMDSATFKNDFEGVYPKYECREDLSVALAPIDNVLIFSKNYISGGAGLICSVMDYAKIVKALTNGGVAENGYRILEEKTVNSLIKSPLPNEFVKHSFYWQGEDYGYGLGVRVRLKDSGYGINKGEFGWDGACGAFWLSDKTSGISIVIGMNVFAWERKYHGIHAEILKEIYAEMNKEKQI